MVFGSQSLYARRNNRFCDATACISLGIIGLCDAKVCIRLVIIGCATNTCISKGIIGSVMQKLDLHQYLLRIELYVSEEGNAREELHQY